MAFVSMNEDQRTGEVKKISKFSSGFVAGGFTCAFVLAFLFPVVSLSVTPAVELGASVIAGVVTGFGSVNT